MAKIMIVDDEPVTQLVARHALEQAQHHVISALNGRECLRMLAAEQPDIALIDVFMPEMDGLELVPLIRERHPNVRIIGMSSGGTYKELSYLDIMLQIGAHKIASKPIKAVDLLALVDDVLSLEIS